MFALEPCMHFDWRAEMWLLPLSMDPVFLHTMIFTSQYYFNSVLAGRKFHSSHYLKALTALRERMEHDGDQDKLSFNTMASVMGLAGQAYMMGDVKTARNHLEGLYRIVELRGGIEIFQGNPKLLVEILRYVVWLITLPRTLGSNFVRCDLGMALYSGSHPVFLEDFASSQPLPDLTPLRSLQEFVEMDATIFSSVKSYELSRMWMFMSEFCCLIDFAAESSTLLTVDIFLGCITSIMYRLIKMRCRQDTVDEAVRLGILALSSGLFLQWKNLGISYPYLASCYKDCLTRLNSTRTPHNLMIWLLVAGAVSLWDISDEAWLAVSLQARVALVRVDRWDTMRTLLKSFMWVDLVHDKAGQRVFDFVLTGRDSPSRGLLR
jgi:hypothetical protein